MRIQLTTYKPATVDVVYRAACRRRRRVAIPIANIRNSVYSLNPKTICVDSVVGLDEGRRIQKRYDSRYIDAIMGG